MRKHHSFLPLLIVRPFSFIYTIYIGLLLLFQADSLDKLEKLLVACEKIGVATKPSVVGGLGLIPLYSWYHEVSV